MGNDRAGGRRICLFVDPSRIYRWQLWLAGDLRENGDEVSLCQAERKGNTAAVCDAMLRLERSIYRLSGEQAFDLVDADMAECTSCADDADYDILIDFTSSDHRRPKARRILTPSFDGVRGDVGLFAALLEKRNVTLRVEDTAETGRSWLARPATEEKYVIGRALNNIFSRTIEFLLLVVEGRGAQTSFVYQQEIDETGPDKAALAAASVAHITRELGGKVTRKLKHMSKPEDRWLSAWRWVDGPGLFDEGKAASATYNLIADDGKRYFADPFVYQKDGVTYIFVEEYPYDTEKGILSVFTLHGDGTVSEPRVVLERPYHLSYPMIYESDGEIWMIPEAGAGGSVELYRATNFPYEWQFEKNLLEDVAGYDATIAEHEGKLWLLMTTSTRFSSSWDNLQLFHSDSLLGEWRPHEKNPVMIDGYVSRPGGDMIRRDGALLRPVQDGSRMYGGDLNLCRVDRLDGEDFDQTLLGSIHVRSPDSSYGIHTINRVGNVEVVDIFGSPPADCTEVVVEYKPAPKSG